MDHTHIISIGLATVCSALFVAKYNQWRRRKLLKNIINISDINVINKNFQVKGDKKTFYSGLAFSYIFFLFSIILSAGSISVCDFISSFLFISLMFSPIFIGGVHSMLVPFRRIVKFNGEEVTYKDVFFYKFTLNKSDITDADIDDNRIRIKAKNKIFSIKLGLTEPEKVYVKLKYWIESRKLESNDLNN